MQMITNSNKLLGNYLYPHPIVQITDSTNQNQQSQCIIQKYNQLKITTNLNGQNYKQLQKNQEKSQEEKLLTFSLRKKVNNHQKYLTLYEEYQKQNKNNQKNKKLEINSDKLSYFGTKQIPIFSNKTIYKSNIINQQNNKNKVQNNLSSQVKNIKIQGKQYKNSGKWIEHKNKSKWIQPNKKSNIMIQILTGKNPIKYNYVNKSTFKKQQNNFKKQTHFQNDNHQKLLFLLGQNKIQNLQHIQNKQYSESEFNPIFSRQQSCHTTSTQSPSPWNSNVYAGYNSQKAYSGYFKAKSKTKFFKQKLLKQQLTSCDFKQKNENKKCYVRPKTCLARVKDNILNQITINLKKQNINQSVATRKNNKKQTIIFNKIEYDKQKQKNQKLIQNQSSLLQLNAFFHRKNSKKGFRQNKQQNKLLQTMFVSTLSGLQKQNQIIQTKNRGENQPKKRCIKQKVYFRQNIKDQPNNFQKSICKKQNLQRSQRYWCDDQIEMETQMFISQVKINKINTKKGVKYARQVYLTQTLGQQNNLC